MIRLWKTGHHFSNCIYILSPSFYAPYRKKQNFRFFVMCFLIQICCTYLSSHRILLPRMLRGLLPYRIDARYRLCFWYQITRAYYIDLWTKSLPVDELNFISFFEVHRNLPRIPVFAYIQFAFLLCKELETKLYFYILLQNILFPPALFSSWPFCSIRFGSILVVIF